MIEFKINDYITLKLERDETIIYVASEPFTKCKYLLLEIPENEIDSYDEINSIDEAAELLDGSLEALNDHLYEDDYNLVKVKIPPLDEFWAHSSNLQAWAENGYDTRLLHSNLAFPLLRKLTKAGDPQARRIFNEEIVKRFLNGPDSVRQFLCVDGYINSLSREQKRLLFKSEAETSVIEGIEDIIDYELGVCVLRLESGGQCFMLRDGKVVGLTLGDDKLSVFPETIRELKSLEFLRISLMGINTIPNWLGELKSIKQLKLSHIKTKELPDSIGELRSLEHLDISYNQLKYLPESMGTLSSLKTLDVSYNNLEELPESVGNLTSLKELDINSNKIKRLPKSIGNLSALEDLSASRNKLKYLPDSMRNLISIKTLGLSHNPIQIIPKFLSRLPSLENIYLFGLKIPLELKMAFKRNKIELSF